MSSEAFNSVLLANGGGSSGGGGSGGNNTSRCRDCPGDITIRSYNPHTKSYEVVIVIESDIYDVTFDVDIPLTEHNPTTNGSTNEPKVIENFDDYIMFFGKPDALKVTVTADGAIGAGPAGSFDLVGFLEGSDKGSIFAYVTDDRPEWNIGIGLGASVEFGFVYSNVDLQKFNRFTLEGYEMNVSGSLGYNAVSIFRGLRGHPNEGFKTGKNPYHGFTIGGGYGTPAMMMNLSKSKLYQESPVLKK